jgi:hypothetical protein
MHTVAALQKGPAKWLQLRCAGSASALDKAQPGVAGASGWLPLGPLEAPTGESCQVAIIHAAPHKWLVGFLLECFPAVKVSAVEYAPVTDEAALHPSVTALGDAFVGKPGLPLRWCKCNPVFQKCGHLLLELMG